MLITFTFLFLARSVAFHTIFEVPEPFVEMLFADLSRVMFVAVVAGVGGVGLIVAHGAGLWTFLAVVQGEDVRCKFGGGPGARRVAAYAVQAKESCVHRRLFVTTGAFARRVLKLLGRVTAGAGHRSMRAVQDKDGSVLEIGHAVQTVMAGQAVLAKERGVFGHKTGLGRGVAGEAIDVGARKVSRHVALGAGHRRALIVRLMSYQAEGSLCVVKDIRRDLRQRCCATVVVRMAFLAATRVAQQAVQPRRTPPLLGDVRVARFTLRGANAAPRRVAGATVVFELRMAGERALIALRRRCDAGGEGRNALFSGCGERSRAKWRAAARVDYGGQSKRQKQRCATAKS